MKIDTKYLIIPEENLCSLAEKLYMKPDEEWREIYELLTKVDPEARAEFDQLSPDAKMEWLVRKTFIYAFIMVLRASNDYYRQCEKGGAACVDHEAHVIEWEAGL